MLRTGVVGVGHIGINHARLYAEIPACRLAAIHDVSLETAVAASRKYGGIATETLEAFADLIDAATISTPTIHHYAVGKFLLERGKHLLIEKPIAENPAEARELAEIAHANHCVLQVGHVERFNPALRAIEGRLPRPRFIEVTRISPYPNRSTDIGVVLDLMIHDLEIVLHLVRSPVTSIDAIGIAVLSKGEDIANVRLHFESGCVANITASRISRKRVREIRVFQNDAYLSLNYQKQSARLYRLLDGKKIKHERVAVEKGEPLKLEIESFVRCASEGLTPEVSGHEATVALELALEITRRIEEGVNRGGA